MEFLHYPISEIINTKIESLKEKSVRFDNLYSEILDNFDLSSLYVAGGVVRDSVLEQITGKNIPINDLDLFYLGNDFSAISSSFVSDKETRYGSLKFKDKDFSLDLYGIEHIWLLNKYPELTKDISNVIKSADLSTSAIFYNFDSGLIYEDGACKDIANGMININDFTQDPVSLVARIIMHSRRLGFKVGDESREFMNLCNKDGFIVELEDFWISKKQGKILNQLKNDFIVISKN